MVAFLRLSACWGLERRGTYAFHYQGLLLGIKVLTQEEEDKQAASMREAGLGVRKPFWGEGKTGNAARRR